MSDESRLWSALIVSVLLHGLVLSFLPLIRRAHIEIPQPQLVDVDLVALPKPAPAPPQAVQAPVAPAPAAPAPVAPPAPKQQIVSQPEEGEEKEPPNARFLSDRNNVVKEEMIHRAQPAAGNPEAKHEAPPHEAPPNERARAKAERPPPAPEVEPGQPRSNTQIASLPKLDQLLPSAGEMIREGSVQPQEAARPAPQQEASTKRTDLLSHGDPWRSGGVRGGSLDFLPSVREGDITMLNTKAERFAPFVRRVGIRVFENFWILVRHRVQGSFRGSAEEFAIIEAIMDKEGRLVSINIKDRSVSIALGTDRNLQSACEEGFFDRNPPAGAEGNDGNIHFLFEAHVAVSMDPSGRGPTGGALLGAGLL